jgi:hypothetical protein
MDYENLSYTLKQQEPNVGFDKTYPFNQKYMLLKHMRIIPLCVSLRNRGQRFNQKYILST